MLLQSFPMSKGGIPEPNHVIAENMRAIRGYVTESNTQHFAKNLGVVLRVLPSPVNARLESISR